MSIGAASVKSRQLMFQCYQYCLYYLWGIDCGK